MRGNGCGIIYIYSICLSDPDENWIMRLGEMAHIRGIDKLYTFFDGLMSRAGE
jgi:hypothetical protein